MERIEDSVVDERGARRDRELRTHVVGDFTLESGAVLKGVRQAYHLDGELNAARDNLIIVFHALTGSADAAGDWWKGLIGPGSALDTDRYAVLCPNLLGSCYGTTWDGAETGPTPEITPRDMARLIAKLVDDHGVRSVALAVGGSLGGMVALEWATTFPDRTRRAAVFAAPAAHTAHAIALNHLQREALELAGSQGTEKALALARMIAMISYRTPDEFESRFGRELRDDGRFQAQSYLDHHGEKLIGRFDRRAYRTLIDAMDAHDVGHGRGGTEATLQAFEGELIAVGIPGDTLYPAAVVRRWAEQAGAVYHEIDSIHGHDAFLIEMEQVDMILRKSLDQAKSKRNSKRKSKPASKRSSSNPLLTRSPSSPRLPHDLSTHHRRVIRLALAGCGTVGGGLIRLLNERASDLETHLDVTFEVVRILVRDTDKDRGLDLPSELLTDDPDVFSATEADIVIEALGGLEPARTVVRTALEAGRDVVTANKLLVAKEGAALARSAAEHGTRLAFEAAVGGGAPVVRTLRDAIAPAGVRSIRGILNGTSNFILSEMDNGTNFDDALAEAQRLGFAEADATRDLDGRDAEDKIKILAWLAYGVDPATLEVERSGLLPDADTLVADAQREGGVLRLVAECTRTEEGVRTVVEPIVVSPGSALGRTRGPDNLVVFETEASGTMRASGPGAGAAPTAAAVLSDIVEFVRSP